MGKIENHACRHEGIGGNGVRLREDSVLERCVVRRMWPLLAGLLVASAFGVGCGGGSQPVPDVDQGLTVGERLIKYQDELRENPDSIEARYQLGNVNFDLGKFKEAMEWYEAALERDPDHMRARANLAGLLQEMGELGGAIREYRRVLEKSPKDARAHSNLGNALYANGQVAEAVDEFRRALELDPNEPHAHYNLGVTFADEGFYDEALLEWRKVLEVASPGSSVAAAAEANIRAVERAKTTYEASSRE